MLSQFTISLIWVPGHWDIVGNCIADELARQGTIMPLLPGKENVGMPVVTCKLNIKKISKLHAPQGNQEEGKTPLVDPIIINPQNQLQRPV